MSEDHPLRSALPYIETTGTPLEPWFTNWPSIPQEKRRKAEVYFVDLHRRLTALLGAEAAEAATGELVTTAVGGLSIASYLDTPRSFPDPWPPGHPDNLEADRKLLRSLCRLLETVRCDGGWPIEDQALRQPGVRRRPGRASVEMTLAIEVEIRAIEQDIKFNKSYYGGAARQRGHSYNTTGALLMEQLQGFQMQNPAAEATWILWHVGAGFAPNCKAIDPEARRTGKGGRWGDPLEGVARSRFVLKHRTVHELQNEWAVLSARLEELARRKEAALLMARNST